MADLTLSTFVDAIRSACDRSDLVVSYDIRTPDNAIAKIRVFLKVEAFIDVYFNPSNQNCSFALIQHGKRIYGADNAFIGWHVHPFHNPEDHQPTSAISFEEFLAEVEAWVDRMFSEATL